MSIQELVEVKVLVKEFDGKIGEAAVQSSLNALVEEMQQRNFVVLDVDLKHARRKYTCVIKYESLLNLAGCVTPIPAAFT
ncbi:hypothetical protein AUJ65_05320 [Candidatus Micrarchaeota archaeon CG1_02_51_15]|nr:MAG: hypothetical protein AUJ65_05320 [Candidatus Micrarchaeota archaeon CG1_02_51_15]